MNPEVNAILTPNQKRWLLMFGLSILSALLGRYLPGVPIPPIPPIPLEMMSAVADTNAAVKRLEIGHAQMMKAVTKVE